MRVDETIAGIFAEARGDSSFLRQHKNASIAKLRWLWLNSDVSSVQVVEKLVEYLQVQRNQGVEFVTLSDSARGILREIYLKSRRGETIAVKPAAQQSLVREPVEEIAPVVTRPAATPVRVEIPAPSGPISDWDAWEAWAKTCAKRIPTLREKWIASVGRRDTDFVMVGDAPSYEDELKGEGFSGETGQKISDVLRAMKLSREEIYLTTVVKFRPNMERQLTRTRPPSGEEMAAFLPIFRAEIALLKPKCILLMGERVAQTVLGNPAPIEQLRGVWHDFEGIPARVTHESSYLLRVSNEKKRIFWEDILAVMQRLELPISDKQRGFFLSPRGA